MSVVLHSVALIVLTLCPCLHAGKHSVPTFLHRVGESGDLQDVNHPSFKAHLQHAFAGKDVTSSISGSIHVSSYMVSSGDDVVVSWEGVAEPSAGDWIGIYCPPQSEENDYLDFMPVNVSSSWAKGSGSFPAKLFNMRDSYQFRYYQLRKGQHAAAAISKVVEVQPHEPTGGRLSLGDEQDTMVLMWTTDSKDDLIVEYCTKLDFPQFKVVPADQISTAKYSADQMCGPPATTVSATTYRDPGFQVTANMRNLSLETVYFYRYGTKGYPLKTTGQFRTRGGEPRTSRFLAFADFGVHYRPYVWQQPGAPMIGEILANVTQKSSVDAIIHFGDLSYGVGHGYIWDQWNWLVSQSAMYTPYMIGVGNHEYDHAVAAPGGVDISGTKGLGFRPSWANFHNDAMGECGVPTFYRFKMPSKHCDGNSVFWYSFEVNNVRFVMMSSEHDYSPGSIQYKWLEQVLASTDRTAFPWLIVSLHRPMYSNESDSESDNIVANHERELFEGLIVQYKVNLMFSGHYHSYMRSCPVVNGKCQRAGTAPVHIVVGTAGAALQHLDSTFPAMWTVFGGIKFGYGAFEVNATHLHFDWMSQDLGTTDLHSADSVDIPLWKD